MAMDTSSGSEILLERQGHAGVITLNRPATLNAINHDMIRTMTCALAEWEGDDAVRLVIIKGNGRAFSAGGDIINVYKAGRAGARPIGFFADEYRLNAAIARFPKPYIALIDGIVMGGGVGVSCHGSHRVVTEKAQFAMPETAIGFFPDVGGSYLLPRLPRSYGVYLGITGNRIGRDEAVAVGLATHTVQSEDLPVLFDALVETGEVEAVLARHATREVGKVDPSVLDSIEHHFSRNTLKACIASLRRVADDGDVFAGETLKTIGKRSPTSLHVTFSQLLRGASLSMDECMRMEFRITNRMLVNHDFYEGIRAALIDKSHAPAWKPGSLEEVDPVEIEAYFAPLGEEELDP